nr:TetR/AcrR family transcriptional regulator [Kineosphaera limosa]
MYDEQLRGALLRAAADRLAAGGVDGLSLRELAASLGTSTNAVYSMFGGKAELVVAVLQQAVDGFSAAQLEAMGQANSVADLRRMGSAYRAWALANPAFYAAMFGHSALSSARPASERDQMPESAAPLLTVVANLIDSGDIRPAPSCWWPPASGHRRTAWSPSKSPCSAARPSATPCSPSTDEPSNGRGSPSRGWPRLRSWTSRASRIRTRSAWARARLSRAEAVGSVTDAIEG